MTFTKLLFYLLLISGITSNSISQNNYNSFNKIDSVYKINEILLEKIHLNEIDKLIINDCNLDEIEKKYSPFQINGIERNFDFKNNKQIEIYQKISSQIKQISNLRLSIDQYLSKLDYWYYKNAIDLLTQKDTINALLSIEKSLSVNFLYLNSLDMKSSILLAQGKTAEAYTIFRYFYTYCNSNYKNHTLLNTSLRTLSDNLKNNAEKYYYSGYYNESLDLYSYGDTLSRLFNLNDSTAFKNGINYSKTGLYQSYLKIAKQAINTQNYSIAEIFTDKAFSYANQHRQAITNDIETDYLYIKIYQKYISISKRNKQNLNYTSSEYYNEKADKICKKIQSQECPSKITIKEEIAEEINVNETKKENTENKQFQYNKPAIPKKINNYRSIKKKPYQTISRKDYSQLRLKQTDYKKKIEIANNLFNSANYNAAYNVYHEASLIFKTNETDSFKLITARFIVNAPLKKTDYKIWLNELTEVDSLLRYSKSLQDKYELYDDKATNVLLNEIQNKINNRKCQNIQDQIDIASSKIAALLKLYDFQSIQSEVIKIDHFKKQSTSCLLNTEISDSIKEKTLTINQYYTLKDLAKNYYHNNDLKNFTKLYTASDSIYKKNRFDTLYIPEYNILSFLKYEQNNKANLFAAEYFLNIHFAENALKILNLLRENNYQCDLTKNIQMKIAIAMASNPIINYEILKNKNNFLDDKKWFKYFINTYISTRN